MKFFKFFYSFKLDNDGIFNEDVGNVFPDDIILIVDPDWNLALSFIAPRLKFNQERIFINLFQKSRAKNPIYFKPCAPYPICNSS